MDKVANLSANDRQELFRETATQRGINPAIVEKDFWVCWVLKQIFTDDRLKTRLVFKGGTSLSKVFGLIDRFSEDIDLILDWRLFGYGEGDRNPPPEFPSNTQRDRFCREVNERAATYIADTLIEDLNRLFSKCAGVAASMDATEPLTVNIAYPAAYSETYLRPEVRLEIGPLASWIPSHDHVIRPYAAEAIPSVFDDPACPVVAIDAERTFWEKATILHQQAHRTDVMPSRYSRHYYDMHRLASSSTKETALGNLQLLSDVVDFKQRFYYCAWAHYEDAKPGSFKLLPSDERLAELRADYRDMGQMIFGTPPSFDDIIANIRILEEEINKLRPAPAGGTTPAMNKMNAKTDGATVNIVEENIQRLRELFPDAFTESSVEGEPRFKVDFDALREILGDYAEDAQERYRFTWNGKARARRIAQTPSTGTLRPCPEESVNWDSTQNLFIEGDNLEVLKLLQKSYHKRIKMIYIDPPYNTGKEFIYPDKFQDNLDTYLRYTGQIDTDGFKLSANAETSGRYHTNWLNMMLPRLRLARNLLRDDGVLFVSIDDIEVANLRKLCDEVFGEENLVAHIIWQHSVQPKGYTDIYSVHHNHILEYRRSEAYEIRALPRTEQDNKNYSNPDNDPRGDWRSGDVRNALLRPNLIYDIKTPSGKVISPPENGWRWSKETLQKKISDGEIFFSRDETRIIRKIYLADQDGRAPETIWFGKDVGVTRKGASELKELFDGKAPFDTVKPTPLIRRMMHVAGVQANDLCLDFFAGSCSTAHAVASEGQGRFIVVQLPEQVDDNLPHGKAARELGLTNIAEIGKERIRRVIKKIEAEQAQKSTDAEGRLPGTSEAVPELDLGFKVFKLDASNIKPWDADFDNLDQALFNSVENIKPDRSEMDVLYELLLKIGLDLAVPIEERTIAGKTVFIIGAGALVVCLASDVTIEAVEGVAKLKEELKPEIMRVVFKDAGFKDDVVKTNAVQILRQAGIEDVKSL